MGVAALLGSLPPLKMGLVVVVQRWSDKSVNSKSPVSPFQNARHHQESHDKLCFRLLLFPD